MKSLEINFGKNIVNPIIHVLLLCVENCLNTFLCCTQLLTRNTGKTKVQHKKGH